MTINSGHSTNDLDARESDLILQQRKQAGIEFPSANKQEHLLIVRLNISEFARENPYAVKSGLKRLCDLFERIYNGSKRTDELTLSGRIVSSPFSRFAFSTTIGFGIGFFEKLSISQHLRPKKLRAMPNHDALGDTTPYRFVQTDLIIQLGSTDDFINRHVLQNALQPYDEIQKEEECPDGVNLEPFQKCCPDGQIVNKGEQCTPDVITAIKEWAVIVDIHNGFQRIDGRNLLGFNDGVSNPRPLSNGFADTVWTNEEDEGSVLKDGTYMVFQKIEHDLNQWTQLTLDEQEECIGRSKGTGLLLGTLSKIDDRKLGRDLKSPDLQVREAAETRLRELLNEQEDPNTPFYDNGNQNYQNIRVSVPCWSHVRKANPRQEKTSNGMRIEKKIIFRRGYLYIENGINNNFHSGLLFICFQRDIDNGFEFIKKNWINNRDFPVPSVRNFTFSEINKRHSSGVYSLKELDVADRRIRSFVGLDNDSDFENKLNESNQKDTQNTGRDGLSAPSKLGVIHSGKSLVTLTLGGGYYFIPPIPDRRIANIGQQFFE